MNEQMEAEHRLSKVEERAKANSHRIRTLEQRQDKIDALVSSMSVLAQKQKTMEEDIGEIRTDVSRLSGAPARRWESIVDRIILGIITALVAYVAVRRGLQ